MSSFETKAEELLSDDQHFYHDPVTQIIQPVLPQLDHFIKSYALFNLSFCVIGFVEVFFLILFFPFLSKSSFLSFGLAIVFLTCFACFIFRLYFNTIKPEKLLEIKDQYIHSCKLLLNYQEGQIEHHMALANASCRLSENLAGKEYTFYKPPQWLNFLAPFVESISYLWHWQDIYKMREILLMTSIQEHIKLVHCEPTSLEIHAALANAYVLLSTLYSSLIKQIEKKSDRWWQAEKYIAALEEKFRLTAQKAIEELNIISDYAPNDPWVHLQLAYSYHDLNMPLDEIHQFEIVLKLNPEDKETLFKLGALYFKEGMNAKGLQVYQELKESHPKKADALIKFYGTE